MRIPEILLLILILIYCVSLPPLLKRAGLKHYLGYIPLVQFFPLLKLIKRPWWWWFLVMIPGVNLIMLIILNVELGIAFNQRSMQRQWFFGLLPWVALPELAFKNKQQPYIGPRDWTGKKKSSSREWGEAIVFAVVAASVIRSFFIEAFTIPTPSMEKSMLVGDYLFVSKMSYGPKIPQTPVSIPFVHNTIPGGMTNSYVDWFSLPYLRLPGWSKVERFDPVVFNFPNGDTILIHPELAGHDYFGFLRREALAQAKKSLVSKLKKEPTDEEIVAEYTIARDKYENIARKHFNKDKKCYDCAPGSIIKIDGVKGRPTDKKENYIKRCIGLPGENLEVRNRQVFINGKAIENPEGLMWNYWFKLSNPAMLEKILKEFDIPKAGNLLYAERSPGELYYLAPFTQEGYEKMKSMSGVESIEVDHDTIPWNEGMLDMYPNSGLGQFRSWTKDEYGPIHIPAKGETIDLTPENVALYKRVIVSYEENSLEEKADGIYINGTKTNQYTFKYDYYWMMGDNRHHSADSRYWGFVPETHVVGKAVFTWFSKENDDHPRDGSIRWNRMFRFVK